jgi:hypothetical protein
MQTRTSRKDRRGDLVPVIVTVLVAVVGTVGILCNDLGFGNDSQGGGNSGMITAAAVSRAGATEIPSNQPPVRAND